MQFIGIMEKLANSTLSYHLTLVYIFILQYFYTKFQSSCTPIKFKVIMLLDHTKIRALKNPGENTVHVDSWL